MDHLGKQLRIVRQRLGMSLRDVSRRCAAIAAEQGSKLYWISWSWLGRVENDSSFEHKLRAHVLIALLSIYGITMEELLAVDTSRELPEDMSSIPEDTQDTIVLVNSAAETAARILLPDDAHLRQVPENTQILRSSMPTKNGRFLRIVVGHENNYLYPVVPGGTVALVDRYRRSLQQQPGNVEVEIQRPMFLLEFRDGKHICCWCELVDESEKRVVILPHPTSRWKAFQVILDRDASVAGQIVVVRVSTTPIRKSSTDDSVTVPGKKRMSKRLDSI